MRCKRLDEHQVDSPSGRSVEPTPVRHTVSVDDPSGGRLRCQRSSGLEVTVDGLWARRNYHWPVGRFIGVTPIVSSVDFANAIVFVSPSGSAASWRGVCFGSQIACVLRVPHGNAVPWAFGSWWD